MPATSMQFRYQIALSITMLNPPNPRHAGLLQSRHPFGAQSRPHFPLSQSRLKRDTIVRTHWQTAQIDRRLPSPPRATRSNMTDNLAQYRGDAAAQPTGAHGRLDANGNVGKAAHAAHQRDSTARAWEEASVSAASTGGERVSRQSMTAGWMHNNARRRGRQFRNRAMSSKSTNPTSCTVRRRRTLEKAVHIVVFE